MPSFRHTVSAIVYAIVSQRCPDSTCEWFFQNDVERFVVAQYDRMSGYLKIPMWLLTLWFDTSTLMRHGRTFHSLDIDRRCLQVDRWRNSRFEVRQNFVRFYESLTVFGWYSSVDEYKC